MHKTSPPPNSILQGHHRYILLKDTKTVGRAEVLKAHKQQATHLTKM